MFNIKFFTKVMIAAMLITIAAPGLAYAQTACLDKSGLFEILMCKAGTTLNDLRPIVYALGGFGIIVFAFAAIFGKINFGHLASIGIGLFLVAVMGQFISYFVGGYGVQLSFNNYLPTNYVAILGTEGQIAKGCMTNGVGECDDKALADKANQGSNSSGSNTSGSDVKGAADNSTSSSASNNSSNTGGAANSGSTSESDSAKDLDDAIKNAVTSPEWTF